MMLFDRVRVLPHREKTRGRITYGLSAFHTRRRRTVALCQHRHETRETAWECPEALAFWEKVH